MPCLSLRQTNVGFHDQLFPVGEYQVCPAQSPQQGGLSPPKERKIRHAPFLMFSQSTRFLFPPFFFSGLSFFLLEMLWTWCQFDMSPYI